MSFLNELKRRNVLRVGAAYVVSAWLLIQVAETIFPLFGYGDTPARVVVIVLAIGLIPAMVFAWAFELTPEGLKKESEIDRSQSISAYTGKKLDRMIMLVLALGLAYFAFDKFLLSPQRQAEELATATQEARMEGHNEALVESYGDKSIAVLPFVDMSAGKDQEYMSDGIAEELLNLLTKIPELRVISRSSAFSYKGKDINLAQVARELNVAHILEGSVRKAGNQVRITTQLIEARSDTHLWSETYDRPLDNIFAIQDEIAAKVVEQLKLKLLGGAPKARAVDPNAYALYLQASQLSYEYTPQAYEQTIALYQQALAIDANYAAAWTGLSEVYREQANDGLRPVDEAHRMAREAANKALSIDPDFAPAHVELGWIAMLYDGDLAAAARHYEQALALEPTNPAIIRNTACCLAVALGRLDTAIAAGEYVTARDPLNPRGHVMLARGYLYAGRLDEAIASLRTALRLRPDYAGAQSKIGDALLLKGEPAAALAAIQAEPSEFWRRVELPMVYHALGRKAESDAALAELIQKHEKDAPSTIAYVLAFRSEADRAFEWLDKAAIYNDLIVIAVQPLFANLHEDPRWLPFLREHGKAPEQLAAIGFMVTLPE